MAIVLPSIFLAMLRAVTARVFSSSCTRRACATCDWVSMAVVGSYVDLEVLAGLQGCHADANGKVGGTHTLRKGGWAVRGSTRLGLVMPREAAWSRYALMAIRMLSVPPEVTLPHVSELPPNMAHVMATISDYRGVNEASEPWAVSMYPISIMSMISLAMSPWTHKPQAGEGRETCWSEGCCSRGTCHTPW